MDYLREVEEASAMRRANQERYDKAVAAALAHHTQAEVARAANVTRQAIGYSAKKLGVQPFKRERTPYPYSPRQERERKPDPPPHLDPIRAANAVSKAVRRGELIKLPCEVCGSTKNLEAHHDDYSKRLDVRWLCSTHHRELHKALRDQ